MTTEPAVYRALEIVNAVEWSGDIRVNMTTVIGAGRVLAKALGCRDAEIERLRSELETQYEIVNYLSAKVDDRDAEIERLRAELKVVHERLSEVESMPPIMRKAGYVAIRMDLGEVLKNNARP